MRLGRRRKQTGPREFPETFVKGWMAATLPGTSPREAQAAVRHLRGQGWTEEELAEFILPYMPIPAQWPPAPGRAGPRRPETVIVPEEVTPAWLDENLPAMDIHELRSVVTELERRGWPSGSLALVVLPHLLPKLPPEEARAIRTGLKDLGMTDEEVARATAPRPGPGS